MCTSCALLQGKGTRTSKQCRSECGQDLLQLLSRWTWPAPLPTPPPRAGYQSQSDLAAPGQPLHMCFNSARRYVQEAICFFVGPWPRFARSLHLPPSLAPKVLPPILAQSISLEEIEVKAGLETTPESWPRRAFDRLGCNQMSRGPNLDRPVYDLAKGYE